MINNVSASSAARSSNEARLSVIRQRIALPEALLFSAFVMAYIWRLQSREFNWWIIFPVWLILSFAFHGDTPKTLGWRADNLWRATRQAALPFALFIAAISVTGLFLGALHLPPGHLIEPLRLTGYFAFSVLEEVGLQSFLMNRLLGALEQSFSAALVSGPRFTMTHWPHPVLRHLS